MDEAVTAEVGRQIRDVISGNAEGAIEAHDVKTRTAGRVTFIEFHLVVPGGMTVATSHGICDRLEEALTKAVPGAQVLIHVEPEEEAKQQGVPCCSSLTRLDGGRGQGCAGRPREAKACPIWKISCSAASGSAH